MTDFHSYNSAISEVVAGRKYIVSFMTADDFQAHDPQRRGYKVYNSSKPWRSIYSNRYLADHGDLILSIDKFAFPAEFDPKTKQVDWTDASLMSDWSSSPVVTGSPNSMLGWISVPASSGFVGEYKPFVDLSTTYAFNPAIDNSSSTIKLLNLNDADWTLSNRQYSLHINQAAALEIENASLVQVALSFMVIVIVCNLTKASIMFLVLLNIDDKHLVTTGDALESFLQDPDPNTVGLCIGSEGEIKSTLARRGTSFPDTVIKWRIRQRRFWLNRSNTSRRNLRSCLECQSHLTTYRTWTDLELSFILSACAVLIGFVFVFIWFANGEKWLWGTSSTKHFTIGNMTFDARGILVNTFIANSPQVLLSGVYFILNTIMTTHSSAL